jgi:hypothetical protein
MSAVRTRRSRRLVLLLAVAAGPEEGSWEIERRETRNGTLVVERGVDADEVPRDRLRLDGETVLEAEYDRLGIEGVFEGATRRDHVVVRRSTGGIACPYLYAVLELEPPGKRTLSPEFGTCREASSIRLVGAALLFTMPAHMPHPELLTAAERRRTGRTIERFTVRAGVVEESEPVRRIE